MTEQLTHMLFVHEEDPMEQKVVKWIQTSDEFGIIDLATLWTSGEGDCQGEGEFQL